MKLPATGDAPTEVAASVLVPKAQKSRQLFWRRNHYATRFYLFFSCG